MTWIVQGNPKAVAAIMKIEEDITKASDRAFGVMIGSVVENLLIGFLRASIHDPKEKIWSSRGHPSGPFGSFAVKIDIVYMMGLIDDDAYFDLCQLKDIRNLFAHDLEVEDFKTQAISSKCANFRLADRHVMEFSQMEGMEEMETERLKRKVKFIVGGKSAAAELKQPRSRFLWEARVLSNVFATERRAPPGEGGT